MIEELRARRSEIKNATYFGGDEERARTRDIEDLRRAAIAEKKQVVKDYDEFIASIKSVRY